jgi:4'-phosphopantetheinyl transferase
VALILPADEIHLWLVATDRPLSAGRERALLAELAPDERERYGRFHFERDRRQYLLARALLRRALSCYMSHPAGSWRFVTNPYGKPALAEQGPQFNLSHADGLVVCALSDGVRLGVDVEHCDRPVDWQRLAGPCLAVEERLWLARQPEAQHRAAFLQLWTLKEAYAKALGYGLSVLPESFAIEPAAAGRADLLRQDLITGVAPDPPGDGAGGWIEAAAKPDDARAWCAALRQCQLVYWRLEAHWLGLAALLQPGQTCRRVVRRDGAPLLAI